MHVNYRIRNKLSILTTLCFINICLSQTCTKRITFAIYANWQSSEEFGNRRKCDVYKKTGDSHTLDCYLFCIGLNPCFHFTVKDENKCYICVDKDHPGPHSGTEATEYTLTPGDRVSEKSDIDDCWTDLCLNGGVCADHEYRYQCNCVSGWAGKLCDQVCSINNNLELYEGNGNDNWFLNLPAWESPIYCPLGSYAVGYKLKFETDQALLDDTALNKVALVCQYEDGSPAGTIISGLLDFGEWTAETLCPDDYFITAFQQLADPKDLNIDNWGVSNLRFRCKGPGISGTNYQDITDITLADEPYWGTWIDFSESCGADEAVCGMSTFNVPYQLLLDDPAMINIKMWCCFCEE